MDWTEYELWEPPLLASSPFQSIRRWWAGDRRVPGWWIDGPLLGQPARWELLTP